MEPEWINSIRNKSAEEVTKIQQAEATDLEVNVPRFKKALEALGIPKALVCLVETLELEIDQFKLRWERFQVTLDRRCDKCNQYTEHTKPVGTAYRLLTLIAGKWYHNCTVECTREEREFLDKLYKLVSMNSED